jgi:hypothetical protein
MLSNESSNIDLNPPALPSRQVALKSDDQEDIGELTPLIREDVFNDTTVAGQSCS